MHALDKLAESTSPSRCFSVSLWHFAGSGRQSCADDRRVARDWRGDGAAVLPRPGRGLHSATGRRGRRPRRWRPSARGTSGSARCVAIEQELSTPADGRALVEKAVAALGRLDILVANHGSVGGRGRAHRRNDRGAVAAHAGGESGCGVRAGAGGGGADANAVHCVQQALRHGERMSDAGHIVLISSTAGQRGEAYHADYAVTKGALISLTKSLSTELAPKGIRVNCVAPGWVATDMSAATLADPATGRRLRRRFRWAAWRLRGRLPGRCCFCARRWPGLSPARC